MRQSEIVEARESDGSSGTGTGMDSPESTDAKAQRILAAALQKRGGLERDHELYLANTALTAQDFRRLLSDIGALKVMAEKLATMDSQVGSILASGLIGHWLTVDPDMVMTWAPRVFDLIPAKEGWFVRDCILGVLAAKRPEQTLDMVRSRSDSAEREHIISKALRELAARNPTKAHAWIEGCNNPADRAVAEKAMRYGMVEGDPLRAIEIAAALESREEASTLIFIAVNRAAEMGSGKLRQLATTPMPSWMLERVLRGFEGADPGLAVDLAIKSGVGATGQQDGLKDAFAALAYRDAAQAIGKLEGLEGRRRAAAVSGIGLQWAAQEPAAALTWLLERERIDPNRNQGTLLQAFSSWASSEAAAARSWADGLPAGPARDAVQAQMARDLAAGGEVSEAAQVLVRLGPAADPEAVTDVARAWAERDPQAAAAWAGSQPAGAIQSRALASVVGTWANEDPTSVASWLTQFPSGEARDHSIAAFLERKGAIIEGGARRLAEFNTWFDQIDDPWVRARVARSQFGMRSETDPAGARAWLSSLTNVDAEVVRTTLRDSQK